MDVTRPLASVSKMIRNHCKVVFDGPEGEGSYILHKPSGDRHKLFLKNGIFVLPVWVMAGPLKQEGESEPDEPAALAPMLGGARDSSFGRQVQP